MNTHKHSSKINKSPHPPQKKKKNTHTHKSPRIRAQRMISKKKRSREGEKAEEGGDARAAPGATCCSAR